MWVRCAPPNPRILETARVLCGKCNSAESRRLAYINHPDIKPGYARRMRQTLRETNFIEAFEGKANKNDRKWQESMDQLYLDLCRES